MGSPAIVADFYGTGNPLPIPECQPYKKSKRFRLLNMVGRLGTKLQKLGGGSKSAAPAPAELDASARLRERLAALRANTEMDASAKQRAVQELYKQH